jgi:hypothetical protein
MQIHHILHIYTNLHKKQPLIIPFINYTDNLWSQYFYYNLYFYNYKHC